MVPAQQMPSILQPLVGYLADRVGRRRFVVVAPALAGIALSSTVLMPNVALVLALLLVSGLASAIFHAPAVALMGEFGGNRMGRAMSIFMAFGDTARTVAPLLMTAAIALFTLRGSVVVMVVGLAASAALALTLNTTKVEERRRAAPQVAVWPLVRARRKPLAGLFACLIVTSVVVTPYQYFLVDLLVQKGDGPWYAGIALSLLFGAGVIGGLAAGGLSDRLGRRLTLTLSALATTPLFYLYLWLENGSWLVLLVLMLAGMASVASRPVTLALSQELMPEARGPMAGMNLAVGFVANSLAALAFGALGDHIGIERAFWFSSAGALLALPTILLLPRHGEPLATP